MLWVTTVPSKTAIARLRAAVITSVEIARSCAVSKILC